MAEDPKGGSYLFQRMAKLRGPYQPSRGSLEFIRATARDLGALSGATPAKVMAAKDVITFDGMSREAVGSMLAFWYDPKTKDTLPYFDRFPLIFVVDIGNGFHYGLNLHYLSPYYRAVFCDKLFTLASDKTFDEKTRLRLSYSLLKNSSRLAPFKPMFKKYLWNHVRSPFKRISAQFWDFALGMPVARFTKAIQEHMWEKSLQQAGATLRRR
jgi:hypothetical protein